MGARVPASVTVAPPVLRPTPRPLPSWRQSAWHSPPSPQFAFAPAPAHFEASLWGTQPIKRSAITTTEDPNATHTSTTTTVTTVSSTVTTTTGGPPTYGGTITEDAFRAWLSIWRNTYKVGLWKANLTDPWESLMPEALRKVKPKVVISTGGVASGIVTEGMGYGLMIEGLLASEGDATSLKNGLSLLKSWLGMVNGPGLFQQPLGGGESKTGSSTKADVWPYGMSAVEWSHEMMGPSGVAAWKFPINKTNILDNEGTATDGDQDAVLGMVYLAGALRYPYDFVDMVVRAIIAFASADLGFPDMYRTLPDGARIYVPRLGSMWGGLTPETGPFKTKQQPWCFSPGYFAPAHYRTFRDFLRTHWKQEFADYLPRHRDGSFSSLDELVSGLDSVVVAGYNILYYSSCESGSVSNWVGVKAPCDNVDGLNCPGVPWAHTPYVGEERGECAQSGTRFGSFGADASRTSWRVAMDYALFREESTKVVMYDRQGRVNEDLMFGSQAYLNRVSGQYMTQAACNGGIPGDCMNLTQDPGRSPYKLAYAWDVEKFNASGVMCPNVPNPPESWWAGFMSYPTFTAFVAPHGGVPAWEMSNWMDTFASMCDFENVDKWEYKKGHQPKGAICQDTYFEASQAVISTLVMAGHLSPMVYIPPQELALVEVRQRSRNAARQRSRSAETSSKPQRPHRGHAGASADVIFKAEAGSRGGGPPSSSGGVGPAAASAAWGSSSVLVAAVAALAVATTLLLVGLGGARLRATGGRCSEDSRREAPYSALLVVPTSALILAESTCAPGGPALDSARALV